MHQFLSEHNSDWNFITLDGFQMHNKNSYFTIYWHHPTDPTSSINIMSYHSFFYASPPCFPTTHCSAILLVWYDWVQGLGLFSVYLFYFYLFSQWHWYCQLLSISWEFMIPLNAKVSVETCQMLIYNIACYHISYMYTDT